MTTERPSVSLSLTELDKGSWVIFELPGFTTAASGTQQNSLDALRKASDTSYFKDKDALWVKVVSTGDSGTGAALVVEPASRSAGKLHPAAMSKSPRRRPGAFCFVPQCCAIGSRNRLRRPGKGPPKIRSKAASLLFSPSTRKSASRTPVARTAASIRSTRSPAANRRNWR